jgi:drug/metabolite transporter (DMT)-like permease
MGDVVVVSPLVATTPAFTLLLGYFVFRRETIRWSSIIAIGLIFTGCVLILTR